MPNAALIPERATSIPALTAVVDGYPDTVHRLNTAIGGAPLEDGAEITDHAVARQAELILTGWVSGLSDETGGKPARAWAAIEQLHEALSPVTVITEYRTFTEMILRRVEARQQGLGARFTIHAEQIIRVGAGVGIAAGSVGGPAGERTEGLTKGRVGTGTVTGEDAPVGESLSNLDRLRTEGSRLADLGSAGEKTLSDMEENIRAIDEGIAMRLAGLDAKIRELDETVNRLEAIADGRAPGVRTRRVVRQIRHNADMVVEAIPEFP